VSLTSPGKHRPSHRSLLRQERCGDGAVDAIVMPASRPVANMLPAMEVASAIGCQFVALCSGRAGVEEAAVLAEELPDLAWTAVELPAGWSTDLLEFSTSEIPEATRSRLGDLSTKRNIGLLLARLLGWRGLLFLDDDIRDVSPRTVRAAGYALRRGRATGMIPTEFPDNSVVCHAARLAGRRQDVFVTGSALAVDTREIASFFPDVYNEDWLFFYDLVRFRRISAAGRVWQAPYRPFENPQRAANQEFGDLLAEGLMSLLHERADVECALELDFWRSAIAERRSMLAGITAELAGVPGGAAALAAVDTARTVLGGLDAELLSMYVRRWRQDVRDWTKRIELLPRLDSVDSALSYLDLPYLAREERVWEAVLA
jgi:hypothetical protein